MVRDRAISKFVTRRVSAGSTGDFFQKILFLPFMATILNLCVKCKNASLKQQETERDFDEMFGLQRLLATLPKIVFPPFGQPS